MPSVVFLYTAYAIIAVRRFLFISRKLYHAPLAVLLSPCLTVINRSNILKPTLHHFFSVNVNKPPFTAFAHWKIAVEIIKLLIFVVDLVVFTIRISFAVLVENVNLVIFPENYSVAITEFISCLRLKIAVILHRHCNFTTGYKPIHSRSGFIGIEIVL